MTIEIREPELLSFLEEQMATGDFASAEEVLLKAVFEGAGHNGISRRGTLTKVLKAGRGLGEGVDFSRDRSAAWDAGLLNGFLRDSIGITQCSQEHCVTSKVCAEIPNS